MTKLIGRVQEFAGQYGWGSVISGFSYVNGLMVVTAGLACFLICVVFAMFGVEPNPPQCSANPLSWILYLMCVSCYGWLIWSFMVSHLMLPLGAAASLLDLLAARKSGSATLYQGAVAGLCLAVIPIALWFQQTNIDAAFLHMASPSAFHLTFIR